MNTFEPPNFFEQIRSNHRRSLVLMAASFVVLYGFINLIVAVFGGYQKTTACTYDSTVSCGTTWYWNPITLVATAAVVAGYLWVAYLSSAKAALSITKAKPADGPEYLQLRNVVEGLAIAAGIPVPAVYVVDDPAPNAFATGLKPEKAAVAVTTGLLAKMSRRELEGVLAHELGHIRNRDTSFMTLVVLTVGAIMVLSSLLVRIGYYATIFMGGNRRSSRDNNDSGAAIGLALLAIGLIGFVIAVPSAMLLKAVWVACSIRTRRWPIASPCCAATRDSTRTAVARSTPVRCSANPPAPSRRALAQPARIRTGRCRRRAVTRWADTPVTRGREPPKSHR